MAVMEPSIRHHVLKVFTFEYTGPRRIRRNIPATTIVELWRRADTGVGPSIAAGSQGCKPNWADFPAAAMRAPTSRIFLREPLGCRINISDKVQELKVVTLREKNRSIPMSPIRL